MDIFLWTTFRSISMRWLAISTPELTITVMNRQCGGKDKRADWVMFPPVQFHHLSRGYSPVLERFSDSHLKRPSLS